MFFPQSAARTNDAFVIAGEMCHGSSVVGWAPGKVREVCFDSCNSSSLIPLQVLGVMVHTEGVMADGGASLLLEFHFKTVTRF